jgi:hypothetical protein
MDAPSARDAGEPRSSPGSARSSMGASVERLLLISVHQMCGARLMVGGEGVEMGLEL